MPGGLILSSKDAMGISLIYLLTYLLTYLLPYLLTYSIEQSPSWEANWFSVSQESPFILWNPKVQFRIHKCPLPVPILCPLDPVNPPYPNSWRSILILSSHLRPGLLSGSEFLVCPISATYTAHLSPLHLLIPKFRSVYYILQHFWVRKVPKT